MRDALVVAEVSISLLLLIGAGLAIRSLQHLAALNLGYDPSHVLTFRVSLQQLHPPGMAADQPDAKVVAVAGGILERIGGLPSVQSAAIATDVPLFTFSNAVFYEAEGQPEISAQAMPRAYSHRVSSGRSPSGSSSDHQLAKIIKRLAVRAGLAAETFSGHSLRSEGGASERAIMEQTRHGPSNRFANTSAGAVCFETMSQRAAACRASAGRTRSPGIPGGWLERRPLACGDGIRPRITTGPGTARPNTQLSCRQT